MRKLKGICQAPEPGWSSGYLDHKKSLHNLLQEVLTQQGLAGPP